MITSSTRPIANNHIESVSTPEDGQPRIGPVEPLIVCVSDFTAANPADQPPDGETAVQ